MRRIEILLLVAVLWAGCAGGSATVPPDGNGTPDGQSPGSGDVILPSDSAPADAGTAELKPRNDAGAEIIPECTPPLVFGCPCKANSECLSGWCVPAWDGGTYCSVMCTDECPPGFTCELMASTCPDCEYVCMDRWVNICRPCNTEEDCFPWGKSDTLCVDQGAAGSFCAPACSTGNDCPPGYGCEEVGTGAGATKQCLKIGAECECNALYVEQAASTQCFVESGSGKCLGKRVCTPDGLTACDAATPSVEVCDGKDNDCNGDTDGEEGLCSGGKTCQCEDGQCGCACPEGESECSGVCVNLHADLNNCGKCGIECEGPAVETAVCQDGECKVAKCAAGFENLDGKFENGCECTVGPEVCDGIDNDCDGVVDGIEQDCTTICETGLKICSQGKWSECSAMAPKTCTVYPACTTDQVCVDKCPPAPSEACNALDDDCDDVADDTFECVMDTIESLECGKCGLKTRQCGHTVCKWGDWTPCVEQGECKPGEVKSQACGKCGIQYSECKADCKWPSLWSGCEGEGACSPGQKETQPCGSCGVQARTCTDQCQWGAWSGCNAQGECIPGEQEVVPCGNCGTQSRSCNAQCMWNAWSPCQGQGVCTPGKSESQACGKCGSQTRACSAQCQWSGWSACLGEGVCVPGAVETQACGNCGTQSRTCTPQCGWGGWGACMGQGECAPNAKQWCTGCQQKTCQANCKWSGCAAACGAQNPNDQCWCDSACVGANDCCPNACTYCSQGCSSCETKECGSSGGSCYCDSACAGMGDCCKDVNSTCGVINTCGEKCGQNPGGWSCGCGSCGFWPWDPSCCKDKGTFCG